MIDRERLQRRTVEEKETKNQFESKFEVLKEHFHSYENAYFGSEPVDKEQTAANDIFE